MGPRLQKLWVLGTVLYSLLRITVVNTYLVEYGVNPIGFAVIELSASLLLGVASSHVLGALLHRQRPPAGWTILTLASYSASDLYIFASSDRLPVTVKVAIGLTVVLSTTVTVLSVVRRIHRHHNDPTGLLDLSEDNS